MQMPVLLTRVVMLAVAAGCAGGGGAATDETAPAARRMTVFARVENLNQFHAVIYTYWNGAWDRLGQVDAGATGIFPFTWDRPEVRFVIELVDNDAITGLPVEDDARKIFAADALRTVPCHLTAPNPIEPNITLMLSVDRGLEKGGGSRCQRRGRG